MTEKIHTKLGDVQKTLLLPLWGRAVETQKPDPLLVDRTAIEIMNKIDYDFSEATSNLSAISQLGWIARSCYIDAVVSRLIEKHPAATIVNIGCGLDTTFDRIDNGRLFWYDLDLPDVVSLRKKLIPEQERRTLIASSFLNRDWLSQLHVEDKVLFLAAGVLYYFEEDQIRAFITRAADIIPGGEMVFDASSPVGIKMANKMVIKASRMDEKSFLKWGLKDASVLASWDRRINVIDESPMFDTMRKRFHIKDKITAWISDVCKMQYMVHLQFTKT